MRQWRIWWTTRQLCQLLLSKLSSLLHVLLQRDYAPWFFQTERLKECDRRRSNWLQRRTFRCRSTVDDYVTQLLISWGIIWITVHIEKFWTASFRSSFKGESICSSCNLDINFFFYVAPVTLWSSLVLCSSNDFDKNWIQASIPRTMMPN